MIVNTSVLYNSNILHNNIISLLNRYKFLIGETIGYSFLGRPIYSLICGKGNKKILYVASTHANEWITSPLLMKFVEDLCIYYENKENFSGFNIQNIFDNITLYIVPMLNPDGVDIVTGLIPSNSIPFIYAQMIANKYPNFPFPGGWKANFRGVDLNLQFPALWKNAKEIKYSQGFTSPAPRDFVGFGPLTEPEALAIYDYSLSNIFDLMITYHTQGQEIYWQFQNYAPNEAYEIGKKFAEVSGYKLADVPYESSFAGFKDWFLQEYQKPAYTIEAGLGQNPLPISQFNEIYQDNIGILLLGISKI